MAEVSACVAGRGGSGGGGADEADAADADAEATEADDGARCWSVSRIMVRTSSAAHKNRNNWQIPRNDKRITSAISWEYQYQDTMQRMNIGMNMQTKTILNCDYSHQ